VDTNTALYSIGESQHTSLNPYSPFNGSIDNAMLLDTALTPTQVLNIYNDYPHGGITAGQ